MADKDEDKEDVWTPIDVEVEKVIIETEKESKLQRNSDVRVSGRCGKCNTRYTNVPLIDGVPQCTICYAL